LGYRPPTRSPQKLGTRKEKTRPRSANRGSRVGTHGRIDDKTLNPTPKERLDRTITKLRVLADQKFILPPFYAHFDRWLVSLRDILSEFESSPTLVADDRFRKETSNALSNIESDLGKIRLRELSEEERLRGLVGVKKLLEQADAEFAEKSRHIRDRREGGLIRAGWDASSARLELQRVSRLKTSLFRGLTKRAKAEKEAEVRQRIQLAEKQSEIVKQSYDSDLDKLKREHEEMRLGILDKHGIKEDTLQEIQTELQTDNSLEARRATCEALVNSMNRLAARRRAQSKTQVGQKQS
jgi:hypothetical protein